MGKKTEHTFNFSVDASIIENTIQQWLSANEFSQYEKNGVKCYRKGYGIITAYKFFEYYINEKKLTIFCYLGSVKHPMSLDNKVVGIAVIISYRNLVENLLNELERIDENSKNNQNSNIYNKDPQNNDVNSENQTNTDNIKSPVNVFKEQSNKARGNGAIMAFVISILSIVISILGGGIGLIFIILSYYLAIKGLKSTEKGLSIAAIVMTSVALFIELLELIYVCIKFMQLMQ